MNKILGTFLAISIINLGAAATIECESETDQKVALDGVDAVSSKKVELRKYQEAGKEVTVTAKVKAVTVYSPAAVKSHNLFLVIENPDKQIDGEEGARASITCELPGAHVGAGKVTSAKIERIGRSLLKKLTVNVKQTVVPDVSNAKDIRIETVQVTLKMGAEGVFDDAIDTKVIDSKKLAKK